MNYVLIMRRESLSPTAPEATTAHDRALFRHHFDLRNRTEAQAYGELTYQDLLGKCPGRVIEATALNSVQVAREVKDIEADLGIVFGTDLIKEPVLGVLPELTLNLHLGLSPWYRGSATLFWPFYFLEPQWAGVTVHRLVEAVDGGEVAFQSTPVLQSGMGIHDVGVGAVKSAIPNILQLIEAVDAGKRINLARQRSSGRIFRTKDFRPCHLRLNYDMFGDRMTDAYLAGLLGVSVPNLVSLSCE
ncbi:MAG: hypothetical protein EBV42_01905 [Actinobacteria bacterium]|nr:hypothetical protein [Actinomycetota bacterium]